MEWVGAKYTVNTNWNFSGAFYHITQNSWTIGLGPTGTNNIGCSGAGLLCAGDFNEASFVVDYVFNKHYDIYGGVNYSEVTDGLANGFVGTTKDGTTGSETQTTVMLGGRVKF
jgi:predicted porin